MGNSWGWYDSTNALANIRPHSTLRIEQQEVIQRVPWGRKCDLILIHRYRIVYLTIVILTPKYE